MILVGVGSWMDQRGQRMARFIRTWERLHLGTEFSGIGGPLGRWLDNKLCEEGAEVS